ncbi:hypothetical protein K491DRAFT_21185 [Lophiostoma macrostomum CBS 122681]|uniref:Uncharacterized protein n=1 Tax=Lophiostoma macrostomum CBS 122681 TaxID=1314788 RepID=A0A6A6SZD8_9PLEO|nr:hypothetical protein K491DRAFT_21185 [Lophiostoma macrostomum CBS 122681]
MLQTGLIRGAFIYLRCSAANPVLADPPYVVSFLDNTLYTLQWTSYNLYLRLRDEKSRKFNWVDVSRRRRYK